MENNITIKPCSIILPTESVFYREFDTRIKIIKLSSQHHFSYNKFDNVGKRRFRIVKIYRNKHEYDCNLYTSDEEIINDVLTSGVQIAEITKPLNKTHKELLHKSDRKIVIRGKLWFNRYKHKITSSHNWDKATTISESRNMIEWIYEHFPKHDNRIVSTAYGSYFNGTNRLSQPPTIFTNSEETMMLMKLAYSNMLRMTMETCITLKELKD